MWIMLIEFVKTTTNNHRAYAMKPGFDFTALLKQRQRI